MAAPRVTDRTVMCVDCVRPFTFRACDAAFYESMGFINADGSARAPKRCPDCRKQKRRGPRVAAVAATIIDGDTTTGLGDVSED